MIGVPGETQEDIFDTILMNLEIRPDVSQYIIFQPYPGIVLRQECLDKKYIMKNLEEFNDCFIKAVLSTLQPSANDVDSLMKLIRFVYAKYGMKAFLVCLIKYSTQLRRLILKILLMIRRAEETYSTQTVNLCNMP